MREMGLIDNNGGIQINPMSTAIIIHTIKKDTSLPGSVFHLFIRLFSHTMFLFTR